jgi:hypothetical protein
MRAPGASLTSDGNVSCAANASVAVFSMLAYHGDSGAPIWQHPDDDALGWLSVHSLVSVGDTDHTGSGLVFGPKFSMRLYRRLVRHLRA